MRPAPRALAERTHGALCALLIGCTLLSPPPISAQGRNAPAAESLLVRTPSSSIAGRLQECAPRNRVTSGALQLGAGVGGGLAATLISAAGILLFASGRYIGSDGERNTDLNRLISFVAYPSYVLGSAGGVYWMGRKREHQGRFWPTLAGSAIGFGAPGATAAYHLFDPSRTGDGGCTAG